MDKECATSETNINSDVDAIEMNDESYLSNDAVKSLSSSSPQAIEANTTTEEDCDGKNKELQEGADGAENEEELSSINSMMSAVMNVNQINGVDGDPTKTSPKTTSRSPSSSRAGRRSQEVKDENSSFICPLCNKNCMTQHQLTMHIRQHNTDSGGTDHSCSICGKALSSASSLDRHMLVHSGERPYKCVICGQTFTTNGNMHRHMKIHEKDPSSIPNPSSSPLKQRRRISSKRKSSVEDEADLFDEPPAKKVTTLIQKPGKDVGVKSEEELLHCPICFKTFICKYGLESHMDTHPDTTLRCNICCITFRTYRGLLRHNSTVHKQLPTDPSGRPFIQNNPSIPLGFADLAFIDFSCHKFPKIAQVWCETNLRRCSSKFHKFVCETCNKAFPLQQSLDLHTSTHNSCADSITKSQEPSADPVVNAPKADSHSVDSMVVDEPVSHVDTISIERKNDFMGFLSLQETSLTKPERSEEQVQQDILDSIHFIRVEPPPPATLPQEKSSAVSISILDPVCLQSLNKNAALSLLSLQPLNGVVHSGMFVPISSKTVVELADIEQILKITSVPPQLSLSLLPKAQGSPLPVEPKQIASLKTPRSSVAASTPPPPVMNAQQASSGNISPSLPPQANQLLRSAGQLSASSSSSTSSSPTNWDMDGIGNTIVSYETGKQEHGKEKETKAGAKKAAKSEFPCRFCKEVFSFLGGLQAHMRHHLGASPYQCTICSYAAPDKATLIRHLRTHSGERPYVCRLCHYPFTVKANCERHLRKKHMKNTRKDIEKNIEYVTTTSASSVVGGTTLDLLETASTGNSSCCYCGEDLKSYRALQIHLRTHNGCQKKPFECRQCGATFLAKRNCIHHLLKQHPDVPEKEIEEHIKSLAPVGVEPTAQTNSCPPNSNGLVKPVILQNARILEPLNLDQPLDFSSKSQKTVKVEETASSLLNDSMEPIDLSIPKDAEKNRTKDLAQKSLNYQVIKKEPLSPSLEVTPGFVAAPVSMSSLASALSSDLYKPFTRLKPLLPKPSSGSNASQIPPLVSIAQMDKVAPSQMLIEAAKDTKSNISSIVFSTLSDRKDFPGTIKPEPVQSGGLLDNSKRRGKKRTFQEDICDPVLATSSGIDLESSGEFPSVEKMLATTDTNKFSPFLQPKEKEMLLISEDVKEGKEDKPKKAPQSKGKKNAYSNSVQKMTCPYCPRVFPWASSLQRHMLTHTGQKPYPCPQCESFFSTKSNCERHLLRKHGMSNRGLQNSSSRDKPKPDEESPESTGTNESTSDTEVPAAGDMEDLSPADPKPDGDFSSLCMASEPLGQSVTQQTDSNTDLNNRQETEGHPEKTEDVDDDSQSNKSLDLNLASKLLDFKLSGAEQHLTSTESDGFPHTCATCKKTFRHSSTLSRHLKSHDQDVPPDDASRKVKHPNPTTELTKELEQEDKSDDEKLENSSSVSSGADEEKEREDLSGDDADGDEEEDEEEDGSSELRKEAGVKTDKRKKICHVCSKRFWSLQDLTRHMRSHTGERPYKCQICHRTFTLKHSLVRHQRLHQKPTDDKGTDEAEFSEETDLAKHDYEVDEDKELFSSRSDQDALAGIQQEIESKIEETEESGEPVKPLREDADIKISGDEEPSKDLQPNMTKRENNSEEPSFSVVLEESQSAPEDVKLS